MAMDMGGAKGGVKSDINVTPLVDVMLVLLIIMMIVAPLLQKGADVKLQACSVCTTTYYCGTTCQHQDWKRHKQTCQPPSAETQA